VLVVSAGVGAAQPASPTSLSEAWRERFADAFDPVDGPLDLSAFLERAAGFLPVPLIVTDPAVGYGGGLLAMFIRPATRSGERGLRAPGHFRRGRHPHSERHAPRLRR
jgi:hypothetical protein